MKKASKRTQRISCVTKVTRSARKLFTSGAFPQACWGHQVVGVAPAQELALRRLAASSTGVSVRSQRCLSSCLFVCFGNRSDPWQAILKELVLLWIKLMPKYYAEAPIDLALAWSKAKQELCEGPTPTTFEEIRKVKIRWRFVSGPLSNVVACLYTLGWNPVAFYEWISPNGDSWTIPTTPGYAFCPYYLVYAIQDQAAALLWAKASQHFNGKGLEHGVAYNYSISLLRNYRLEALYDRAAALETIMSGACWSPQRKFEAGLISYDQTVCPMCFEMGCDDYHQFWGCPHLDTAIWPEI